MAVAEERHFSRAAERLHVVQSAVSTAIKKLERELGGPLLERNAKRVELTDAGAALLPQARVALDAAREAGDAVAAVLGGLRGTLRLGTLTSVRIIDLPALLGEYHRRHPGVQLVTSVAASGSRSLVEALIDRRLDLAFISWPGSPPPGIDVRDLTHSVLDLVVPDDHPLAGRDTVALDELAGLTFIDSPLGYGNRTVADNAFRVARVSRRVSIEIADIAMGADYVRHGLGVALLPRFILSETDGIHVARVTGADLDWPLSVATPADRRPSAAARALLDLIDDALA